MSVPSAGSSCRLNMLSATVAVTIPPIMNTSPWAKLISSRMP